MTGDKDGGRDRIVAISDTHFGDRSMLLDDRKLVDRLAGVLEGRGEISELILLGDIIDLWARTPVPALRKARYFIEAISGLGNIGKVTYVPGNHDHQMFLDAFRLEQDTRIARGDLSLPRFMPARHYGDTIISGLARPGSGARFSMTYPFVLRKPGGRDVLFSHGHHLDYYATSHGWARTFWLGRYIIRKRRGKATLHDIEMANIPFYGAMSAAPWVPELVEEGMRYYRVLSFFSRLFRSKSLRRSPLRDSLIRENYEEIGRLLPQLGHPRPACFVFGHTHRPGIGTLPGTSVKIANCGSWTRPEEGGVPSRTWVEVDEVDVKLYRLSRGGVELIDEACLYPDD